MRTTRCLIGLVVAIATPMSAMAADLPQFADAPLRAVHFVDKDEGWTAGDDGVILHTIDCGRTWERQPTGVRASLRSIHFLDPFTGFVVGRESLAHGTGSAGVILFTDDGGVKWQRVSLKEMPGFHKIQFVDKRTAFLVGDATDHFPTGLFITEDSGVTWKPVPGPRCPGWTGGHFEEDKSGVVVGPWGYIGQVYKGELQRGINSIDFAGSAARDVRSVNAKKIVAGDGGIREHRNSFHGKSGPPSYDEINLGYSQALQKCVDFHAMHFVGEHGWVVGRPGTQVLHTWDGGKSWQAQSTGQNLPLHAVFFADAKNGWAVGEMGTVLGTTDGGKSWKIQRRGGQRAAVLFVNAKGEFLPAGAMAALGMDESYLCAAVRVSCSNPKSAAPGQSMERARFAEAVRMAGGCGGEVLGQFPLPQHFEKATAADLVKFWGQTADEAKGMDELQRQLVLAIRIWQPDVIITDNADPLSPTGQSGAVVALALTKAFELAGKADAYPEQITKLGLEPWSASKLYGRWEKREAAHVDLELGQFQPNLKASAKRFVAPCLALLFDEPSESPAQMYFRLLATRIEKAESHKHPLSCLNLAHGGQARRALSNLELTPEGEALLKQIENQHRDVVAIANEAMKDAPHARGMLANVAKSLNGLDEDRAGDAAFAIGMMYARSGQWPMAKEVFLLLIDRYPAHRLAPDACRWLIRYGGSSEARRREELGQFWITGRYEFQTAKNTDKNGTGPIRVSDTVKPKRDFAQTLYKKADDLREFHKSTVALAEQLNLYGPLFANDPEFQFPVQAAKRSLGEFDAAQLWYTNFRLGQSAGPWLDAAGTELWLQKRQGQPPKPVAFCVTAVKPPFLDGKFDDDCWKDAKGVLFKDAVNTTAADHPTECWLSHDVNFLYVAIRCKHPKGKRVEPVKPRQRDEDLSRHDRVSIMLDLDRDYATYFRFEVDQRGCVCEDCWGDKSWNPKWYVAVDSDETCWKIEAAIPLSELTGDKIHSSTIWAANVVRTIPNQGVQAFSTPADVNPRPEGMGLLSFLRSDPKTGSPANPFPKMEPAKD